MSNTHINNSQNTFGYDSSEVNNFHKSSDLDIVENLQSKPRVHEVAAKFNELFDEILQITNRFDTPDQLALMPDNIKKVFEKLKESSSVFIGIRQKISFKENLIGVEIELGKILWFDYKDQKNMTFNDANEKAMIEGKRLPTKEEWNKVLGVFNSERDYLVDILGMREFQYWSSDDSKSQNANYWFLDLSKGITIAKSNPDKEYGVRFISD